MDWRVVWAHADDRAPVIGSIVADKVLASEPVGASAIGALIDSGEWTDAAHALRFRFLDSGLTEANRLLCRVQLARLLDVLGHRGRSLAQLDLVANGNPARAVGNLVRNYLEHREPTGGKVPDMLAQAAAARAAGKDEQALGYYQRASRARQQIPPPRLVFELEELAAYGAEIGELRRTAAELERILDEIRSRRSASAAMLASGFRWLLADLKAATESALDQGEGALHSDLRDVRAIVQRLSDATIEFSALYGTVPGAPATAGMAPELRPSPSPIESVDRVVEPIVTARLDPTAGSEPSFAEAARSLCRQIIVDRCFAASHPQRLADLVAHLDDRALQFEALVADTITHLWNDMPAAIAAAERLGALRLSMTSSELADVHPMALCGAWNYQGSVALFCLDHDAAVRCYIEAFDVAEKCADHPLAIRVMTNVCNASILSGDLVTAAAAEAWVAERTMDHWESADGRDVEPHTICSVLLATATSDAELMHSLAELIEGLVESPEWSMRSFGYAALARWLLAQGDGPAALAATDMALEGTSRVNPSSLLLGAAAATKASVLNALGRWSEAIDVAADGISSANERGAEYQRLALACPLFIGYIGAGRSDEAMTLLDACGPALFRRGVLIDGAPLLDGSLHSTLPLGHALRVHDAIASSFQWPGEVESDVAIDAGPAQRRAARDATQAVNRYMTEHQTLQNEQRHMVDSVAHDIRTPLMSLQLILERDDALQRPDQMFALIDRMEEVLRGLPATDSRQPSVVPAELSVSTLVADLVAEFEPSFSAKSLSLSVDCPPEAVCVGPQDVIVRALSNLISNAIKFSDVRGHISIEAMNVGFSQMAISVVDNGQGFQTAEISQMFNWRGRASSRPTAGERTEGLGLSIASSIVRQIGGQIDAYSDGPGRGAVFSLFLPRRFDEVAGPRLWVEQARTRRHA